MSVHTSPAAGVRESFVTTRRIGVVGNPNSGKTTLFNKLCGLRAKTANFPGTTVEARFGTLTGSDPIQRFELVDLPGHYGLNLDRPESRICRDYLAGRLGGTRRPESVLVVVDATNLARNLIFASQALQQGLPAVVALTMIDVARRRGMLIDVERLGRELACPVVPVSARTGEGIEALRAALTAPALSRAPLPDPTRAQQAAEWAERVAAAAVDPGAAAASDGLTDRLDRALTHPVLGVLAFGAVMTGLFWTIFSLASVPMDLIEVIFVLLGDWAGARMTATGPHPCALCRADHGTVGDG